ncbi:MAG: AAA family ATPase, partial [Armatimonadota bacterium]
LVKGTEWLDIFPLHAFADILQWREERFDFEVIAEGVPQVYFRLSDKGYLEFVPFSERAAFSHLKGSAYQRFQEIFQLEEWRRQRKQRAEGEGQMVMFDQLMEELTEVFVGRKEHLKQVKERIKQAERGVLWVSGKPGVGKSALMAKLAKDYQGQQHYIVIPYFFRFGQVGCSVGEFLSVSLKRLQAELGKAIEPAPTLPERQQQFVSAVDEVAKNLGKKVLFLVDGLDEIYRKEREFVNLPFMTLAKNVVWVCSGRSEPELERELRQRGAEWVFEEGLPPLDETAIRAMLTEHLGRLKYQLFERDDEQGRNRFIDVVARKSEGLPLYVRMVIEDLKAGRWTVYDEEKLPEGLVAYFEEILERLRVSDVGTVLTPMFCLLAWAQEPVTEQTLNTLLKTHHLSSSARWESLFQRAVEHGHMMLQRRPNSDGELGWAIYHDAFRNHLLTTDVVRENSEWAERRWVELCGQWKGLRSTDSSLFRYALRHYAMHLHQSGEHKVLFDLARDEDFAQTQREVLPHEPDLPLKTIQLALDAAIKKDDAERMAEMVLRHAISVERAETPLQAQKRGEKERAIGLAKQRMERDYKAGTLWLLLLAWSWEMEGKRDLAQRCLKEISQWWQGKSLEKLGERWEEWQGYMAAILLGELWQVEGWFEVGQMVLRDEGLKSLALHLAQKGKFEEAVKVAKRVEDVRERSWALEEIARVMMWVGMGERAKEILKAAVEAAKE